MAIKRSRRRSSIITNTPIFLFILSCFCIIMEPFSSHAVGDTITKDQNVTLWDPLISSNGNFKLGFFKPGRSDNYFLGIWYNKSPEIKPVWVANRNSPIYDTSGALAITDDGILYITYGSNFIVLNSNQGATFDNLTAKLLDSGNFVLSREMSSSKGSDVLWQSFDYPTDTILDGMKVGLNLKTGQTWSLTSWLSYSAPAPGAFTLGIDPNGTKQWVLWQRGEVISTSGIWHNGSFPEDYNNYFWRNDRRTSDSIYNISYVSTVDEEYFTFSLYKNYYYSGYSSTSIIMGVLDPWGQFSTQVLEEGANFYTWGNNPEIIGSCKEGNTYNYHNDGVCMVHKRLDCSSSPNEEFSLAKGFFGGIASLDLNLGISDCDAKCRSNCSCIAYSSFYDNGTGCVFWYKELGFTTSAESGNGFDVYALTGLLEDQGNDGTGGGNGLPTLNSTSGAGREKKKQRPAMQSTKTWWWLWSIMAVAPVVTVLLFGSLCYLRRYFKLKGEKKTIQKKFLLELGTNINMNKIGKEGKKGDELQIFSFNSITSATANFSSTNKLGEGGFGPVYKGKLLEGQEIAVKRLSRSSGQGQEEFKNEIVLIAKLQHMNLVRLLGCCIHVDEKMLIYEYMPNNSLDVYLFDPTKKKLLDWKRRLNIIEGIAQGLLYLHKFSRLRVIHRDLKASNILLDAEMNPKISDFGMARIFGRNESEANTNRVVGTYGYMSPEYAMEGIFSVKSDAYSFGVLLLEIISGRKNTGSYHPDRPISLIGYAWDLWKESKALELMDPILSDSCPIDDLLRCTYVGLLCVQEMANDRPTMSDVISMLTNETFPRPAPKQPAFYLGRSVIKDGLPKDESKNCSINDVSISIIEAR